MPENSSDLRDTVYADLTEDRHPSAAELRWAEQTLGPALAKNPEHPIGAPTGINRDEAGQRAFHHRFRRARPAPLHGRGLA